MVHGFLCVFLERFLGQCLKGMASSCHAWTCSWISPIPRCPSTLRPTTLEDTTLKLKVKCLWVSLVGLLNDPRTFSENAYITSRITNMCVKNTPMKIEVDKVQSSLLNHMDLYECCCFFFFGILN